MRNSVLWLLFLFMLIGCGTKNKEQLFTEGMNKAGEGANEAAIVFFKNALEKDTNFTDARYQLAKAYQALGKYEQAEREFQKVIKQDPSRSNVRLDLARVFNCRKMPIEALKEVDAFLQANPGSHEGLEAQGVAYSLQNNFPLAEQALLRVIQADPKKIQPKLELAVVYLSQNRDQEGRRLLDEIITVEPNNPRPLYLLASLESVRGNKDKALAIYNQIAATNPNDAMAAFKAGNIILHKGDLVKAEALADDLIKRMPKMGEGHRLKGLVQYQQKKYSDAITSLQTAVKYSPTVDGFYFLGLCFYQKGELESSLSQFRRVIDVAPDFVNARLMNGLVLLSQRRIDDALNEIRKVLEIDDHNALAHNLLGSALIAKGQFDDGMKELNRATSIDPMIVDAHLKKGVFHLHQGKVAEAETDLTIAVQVAPEVLNTRLMLASLYMRQGKVAKAKEILKVGLKGNADDAVLYNSLAGVSFSEGKKDEALQLLAKAKQLNPLFSQAYYNLAAYYATLGNYDLAKAEYQSLLQKSPSDVRSLIGLAALSELNNQDKDALAYYAKAKETKSPQAYLAFAAYYVKKKDLGKAIKVLDEAIKEIPRNVAAMEMKGRILVADQKTSDAIKVFDDIEQVSKESGIALKIAAYIAKRDFVKAEEHARRAISLQPKSANGYLALASVYQAQNNNRRAIEEMKNGLKIDPANPQALLLLGNLHAINKEFDLAQAAYLDAVKVNKDFIPAIFAQGVLLEQAGKKKDAIRKYREALTRDESYVPALNNLAYLLADGLGSRDEALRLAISAYKQKPGDAAILDTVGFVLLVNGRSREALKALQKSAEALGENPSIQYHLALAYKANNLKSEEAKALLKALAKSDFPERAAALKLQGELK